LAEMQRAAPNGQLVQFPACGHMIPMELPKEFAAAISGWWQGVTGSND
jgi:pimeloyl-ACP methyl ester carboxylesterase